MSLDLRTLFIVHSLVSIALALLMVVFWCAHRRMPGPGHWTLGTALLGLGILGGGLRGMLPDFLSIVVANSLVVLSIAAFWNGIRAFDGRPPRWREAALATAGIAAILAYWTYGVEDVGSRIVVVSAALSLGCFFCTHALLAGPARSLRIAGSFAAVLFGLVAATLAARAAWTALQPATPGLFADATVHSIHFLVSLVSEMLVVVSLLMMAAQRLQQQVEARNALLEEATARAERASRAKSEFLATMSHELRTPLNAIIGFSDVQLSEMFGPIGHPRYREYAADIRASGTHLLGLITSILDISKAEAGKLEVAPVELELQPVLEAAMALVRGSAEAKRIRLSVAGTGGPALLCRADPQALKQILVNLLSNAVKFTPEDGAVTVRLRADADAVEIAVCDTGVGIAADDLPRLMKPFEQVAQGYARQNGGTGLGLPLVDALVRLHGGTVHIASAVGQGTAVTVRLPSGDSPALSKVP